MVVSELSSFLIRNKIRFSISKQRKKIIGSINLRYKETKPLSGQPWITITFNPQGGAKRHTDSSQKCSAYRN